MFLLSFPLHFAFGILYLRPVYFGMLFLGIVDIFILFVYKNENKGVKQKIINYLIQSQRVDLVYLRETKV